MIVYSGAWWPEINREEATFVLEPREDEATELKVLVAVSSLWGGEENGVP